MLTRWEPFAAVAFALGGLYMAVQFRRGRMRNLARWHGRRDLPFYIRNLPFALLPYALVFAAWVALFAFVAAGWTWAGIVVGYSSFAFFVVAVWWSLRPPRFLKPDWLRESEARDTAHGRHGRS
jgi:hypothetical protein